MSSRFWNFSLNFTPCTWTLIFLFLWIVTTNLANIQSWCGCCKRFCWSQSALISFPSLRVGQKNTFAKKNTITSQSLSLRSCKAFAQEGWPILIRPQLLEKIIAPVNSLGFVFHIDLSHNSPLLAKRWLGVGIWVFWFTATSLGFSFQRGGWGRENLFLGSATWRHCNAILWGDTL